MPRSVAASTSTVSMPMLDFTTAWRLAQESRISPPIISRPEGNTTAESPINSTSSRGGYLYSRKSSWFFPITSSQPAPRRISSATLSRVGPVKQTFRLVAIGRVSAEVVKFFRGLSEQPFLSLIVEIFSSGEVIDVFRKFSVPMRVIRSIINDVVRNHLSGSANQRLVVFGMEVDAPFLEVFRWLLLAFGSFHRTPLFPLLVHSPEPVGRPATTRLHISDPEFGELIKNAAEHHARALHHLGKGMRQRMNFDKLIEHVGGKIMRTAHRGVNSDHAVELLRFLVNRPEALVPQWQS